MTDSRGGVLRFIGADGHLLQSHMRTDRAQLASRGHAIGCEGHRPVRTAHVDNTRKIAPASN